MSRRIWLAVAAFTLGGCRIVSQQELADLKNPAAPHVNQVAQTWQQNIVPQVVSEAKPVAELMQHFAASTDFAATCQQYGYRAQAENPCVFPVHVSGSVTEVNTTSKSGKMTVQDVGGARVVVQIGPIIRGTALRDAYKGLSYQDFNDQVLFGDYARAINDLASAEIQEMQLKTGDRLDVYGVFSVWDVPQTLPDITPARVTRQ
ncbi:DUF2291 family protein [Brenneria tiliae]|uniref:DUF2291 family protein n=1 Tax=Brenneria tiliae TaxID=2914984 RepID=UPI00201485DD|nr:DUF2291 domain-containing protein [Brenneria tiliae]MCL2899406.1 DUF2291 domain-containing protein [Brenneria tiliae]MCL2903784.1 DUF2291 domain-containing protein [Brenneria tiliae]